MEWWDNWTIYEHYVINQVCGFWKKYFHISPFTIESFQILSCSGGLTKKFFNMFYVQKLFYCAL